MPLWLFGLITLATAYGFFCLFAWLAADGMIFRPRVADYDDTLQGYVGIQAPDGVNIAAVHLPDPTAKYTVIYFHGNAEDIGDLHERLVDFQARGFNAVGFDSRGYGLTPGVPREATLYEDMEVVYEYVTRTLGVAPGRIILYGFSLGSGAAVELATRQPVGGLVIQAGFTSAFRTVTGVTLLPWDRFRNLEKLARVRCPVLVMHGTRDATIPFSHGRKLYEAISGPKLSYWLEDAGHNNFLERAGEEYWATLAKFVELVEQSAPSP